MQKPDIAELQNTNRYQLLSELDMNNPAPFFKEQSKGSRVVGGFFLLILLGLGLLLGYTLGQARNTPTVLWQVPLALAVVFVLLLPLHEGIHALTYRWMGARDIRFALQWRKLAVYTCANRFVISIREMIPLALAPFVCISLGLLPVALLLPPYRLALLWALGMHAFLCGGDIILLAYALRHRHRPIYNFDDVAQSRSYFLERKETETVPAIKQQAS